VETQKKMEVVEWVDALTFSKGNRGRGGSGIDWSKDVLVCSVHNRMGGTRPALAISMGAELAKRSGIEAGSKMSFKWRGFTNGCIYLCKDGSWKFRYDGKKMTTRLTMQSKKMPFFKEQTVVKVTLVQNGQIFFEIDPATLDFSRMV
jgi:hypothetical protein